MGRLPICGKTSLLLEDFPCIGGLPIYYIGRLPIYGKTSHIWEDFPYMESQ
jgi:hypothetical protein